MNKKQVISDLLVIVIAFILLFIWQSIEQNKTGVITTSADRFYDIYLITIDKKDQHWYLLNEGAADMAYMMGVNYRWEAPETKNTQEQIDILNRAVEAGADAILIAVNDPIKMSGPIEDAKAKSVKIIYVDTPAYEEATITLSTDNYNAGITAANNMLYELDEIGTKSGKIGIIGVNETTDSTLKREAGFRATIEANGKFELLPTAYENGDPIASQKAAQGFINNNPDLIGLFGTNEGTTVAVGNAIKESEHKVIGIGFDTSDAILALIREGHLKATVAQNPYTMGYLGMAEAVAALNGYSTGPSYINTGVSVIRNR